MNKAVIERIENIDNKFNYVPVVVVLLMLFSIIALRYIELKIITPFEIMFIGAFIVLFFNQIKLKLQVKSLLRILKNES